MSANIKVGILFAPRIHFFLNGLYRINGREEPVGGEAFAVLNDDQSVTLSVNDIAITENLPLEFYPLEESTSSFELKEVTIGINFHWERKENQVFRGGLIIIRENDHLTAINHLPLEEYLKSVISSEMSATSSEELLKAHAIVSRSWLLAQVEKEEMLKKTEAQVSGHFTPSEHIRWYDREDHLNFHVCADDHCQRYQGITRATTTAVEKAIDETYGMVVSFGGNICDARYSKCCGGISEQFEHVWEPVHHPYLSKVVDADKVPAGFDVNLDTEEKAHHWITGMPEAFCNTSDKQILSQVLNDYDQETNDFFRWKKVYTQEQLTALMKKRIGVDVGNIIDLVPVERGVSGRLVKLMVKGTERTMIIGKELEIRKAFSESHLYSSAFVIEARDKTNGIPQQFILTGAGWGHGVGLCQIGAAVMGAKGYDHQQILQHYFKGAVLTKKY
jgi:stage II sporulation protein D